MCARMAWKVIFSRLVDIEEKRVYILPVAIMLVVVLEGLFEDTMGSTGKGTVHGLIFGMGIPVVYLYGKRLLKAAEGSAATEKKKAGWRTTRLARQDAG